MYYIGIDPGQNGGISCVDTKGNGFAWPMPVFPKDERKAMGGSIDWRRVDEIFHHIKTAAGTRMEQTHCMLEKVWAIKGQGVTSSFSFGGAYHGMLVFLQTLKIEYDLVVPRTWKNAMLGETYTHDKAGAILYCGDHYPGTNLIPTRCRVEHDGMADSLVIADYAAQEHKKHL